MSRCWSRARARTGWSVSWPASPAPAPKRCTDHAVLARPATRSAVLGLQCLLVPDAARHPGRGFGAADFAADRPAHDQLAVALPGGPAGARRRSADTPEESR